MSEKSSHTPLEKRIKRHVLGRRRAFFAVATPGLESVLLNEVSSLSVPVEGAALTPGGVEFTGPFQICYHANLMLRTANRVLMRLTDFRAENFRQLRKGLSEVPWELFLSPMSIPEVRATTRHSRLYHTDAVTGHVVESVRDRLSRKAPPPPEGNGRGPHATIFVRADKDRFTLSLDSSGELLHRRGIKTQTARAPIRETMAAAALLLAGYDGSRPLIDPMCGSGTFSIEAALICRNIPPGWFREFAFMTWPAFRPRAWAYLKRQAERDFRAPPGRPSILASDIDGRACKSLKKRLDQAALPHTVAVETKDFFGSHPPAAPQGPGIVIINPPYGRRLGSRKESEALFFEVCRKLEKDYGRWRVALIVPRRHLLRKIPFSLDHLPFQHGGLSLTLAVGTIP